MKLPEDDSTMCVYKIRDKVTGLFSNGGVTPKWVKSGKVWTSRGALKSHLTLYCDKIYDYSTGTYVQRNIPDSWEILEFEFQPVSHRTFSAKEEAARVAKK